VVGEENPKTFLLHSELLTHESDRLAKDVNGGFNEESKRRISLDEEDSELFGYFVEYLYRSGWLAEGEIRRDTDYIILARLYALGERLQAHKFQLAALRKFTPSFGRKISLSDQCICDLLDIACAELPERIVEDPMRAQIFWYAASRLTHLQDYDYFLRLLQMHKELGRYLCTRAGNGTQSQPPGPPEPPEPQHMRFRPESIHHA
jgi:hypothetical protein